MWGKPRPGQVKWLFKVPHVISDGAGHNTWASSLSSPPAHNTHSRCFFGYLARGEGQICCLLLGLSQNKQRIYFCKKTACLGHSWNLMTTCMHTTLEMCIQSGTNISWEYTLPLASTNLRAWTTRWNFWSNWRVKHPYFSLLSPRTPLKGQ